MELPEGPFRVIYADPPWNFKTFSEKGRDRSPDGQGHYNVMSLEDIQRLPVRDITDINSFLFLWVTDPLLIQGIQTMEKWGFRYVTVAFTWVKTRPTKDDGWRWHMGNGYYTRANPEMCLLGRRGKGPINRKNADVRQLIIDPIREHSRKPARVRDSIERLFDGPYLEMFGRSKRDGWTVWGNQTDKFKEQ